MVIKWGKFDVLQHELLSLLASLKPTLTNVESMGHQEHTICCLLAATTLQAIAWIHELVFVVLTN